MGYKSNKITAIIPARGGSKGVPGKNKRNLHNHPLISYSIMTCKLSNYVGETIVSTDSEAIKLIAENYGAKVLDRPSEFAGDNSTDWQVISHFFENFDDDDVAYIRPTTPLRNPEVLDNGINTFFENSEKMSGLRSMHELPESPYKVFKINDDGYCEGFFDEYDGILDYTNLPRQNFPKAYQPNGYIDISKRETVESGKSAFAMDIMPFITEFVTEIDAQYEFDLLDYQLGMGDNILLEHLNEEKPGGYQSGD
jgi:CMP-N,N'-diacetyllegionaminic acid synthase